MTSYLLPVVVTTLNQVSDAVESLECLRGILNRPVCNVGSGVHLPDFGSNPGGRLVRLHALLNSVLSLLSVPMITG